MTTTNWLLNMICLQWSQKVPSINFSDIFKTSNNNDNNNDNDNNNNNNNSNSNNYNNNNNDDDHNNNNNNKPTSKIRQASLQLFRSSDEDGVLPYRAALLVINSTASARAPSLKSVKNSLSSCDCLFVLTTFSDFLWSDLTLLSEIAACLKWMKIVRP